MDWFLYDKSLDYDRVKWQDFDFIMLDVTDTEIYEFPNKWNFNFSSNKNTNQIKILIYSILIYSTATLWQKAISWRGWPLNLTWSWHKFGTVKLTHFRPMPIAFHHFQGVKWNTELKWVKPYIDTEIKKKQFLKILRTDFLFIHWALL